MSKKFLFTCFFLVIALITNAQFRINGFVADSISHEYLIGANIANTKTLKGVSTDNNGYFSMITNYGQISISFIGYKTQTMNIVSDTLIGIQLVPGENIDEVIIKYTNKKQFNVSTLSIKELENLPTVGGKPDVLKSLQLLPGIQTQSEGSSLLNVRGGNPGENLYLLDNIQLIYVNHLGGFLSVFNPDIISNVELFKGAFPAKYGEKLSSIVRISQREGDKSKSKGSFSIGMTDASFHLEGPMLNNKGSFIVTGRKTMVDGLYLLATHLTDSDFNMFYGFHDFNSKFSYRYNYKNKFYLYAYQGDDYLNYWTDNKSSNYEKYSFLNFWGNFMTAVRWDHLINNKIFINNTLSYNRYRLKSRNKFTSTTDNDSNYDNFTKSSVKDLTFKSNWKYQILKEYEIQFGTKLSRINYIPNYSSESDISTSSNSNTAAIFIENHFEILNHINIDAGLRSVYYNNEDFNDFALEPRFSIQVNTGNNSFNASIQNVNQFSHLLFSSGNSLTNEIWIPATSTILPSQSWQYSLGWQYQTNNGKFSLESNIYYKTLNQLAMYKTGYSYLLGDTNWETKVEKNGQGKAKGFELLLRKNKGNWTGFLAYNYSNSLRKYTNINDGNWFVFDYDRPHNITLSLYNQLNQRWDFSAIWNYQTGLPYTPVLGRQLLPNLSGSEITYDEEYIYGDWNSERMLAYHRLDVSFKYNKINKKGRKVIWSFGVYNLYNRKNAAAYYYGTSPNGYSYNIENPNIKQYKISYFPVWPSVTYKVFFDGRKNNEKTEKESLKNRFIKYLKYEK